MLLGGIPTPLKNMSSSVGFILQKPCSKPPTRMYLLHSFETLSRPQPTHPNSQRPGKPHVSTPFQRISNLQSHKQRHLPRTIPFWGYSTPWKVAHDITVFYYFFGVIPWFLTELGSIRVFITQWLAHWRSRKAIDWQLNFGFDHPVPKTNPRHGNFWVQHFWIHHRGWKGVVTREQGR